ncbi:MAG: hypothetical protein AAF705_12265 [Bacteroidota bacterium]
MNLLFQEGDLTFSFAAEHWSVKKYDDHPYFKGFSGVGLKGVDFVAIFQNKRVLLIEVKNYQTKNQAIRAKDVALSLSKPEKIAEAISQKFEDTLAGIKAIHTYYQRKSKPAWKWLQRWQKPDPEALFWQSVCDLVINKQSLSTILWLEYDPQDQLLAEAIGSVLLLKAKQLPGSVQVFNHLNHPFGDLLLTKDLNNRF